MSKSVKKFDALFNGKQPVQTKEVPLGTQVSIYLSRETQSGVDRVMEYYRRKHGDTRMSRSNVVRIAVAALVQALDEKAPDFDGPQVEVPN